MKKQLVIVLVSLLSSSTFAAVPKKMNAFDEGDRLIFTRLVEAFRHNRLQEVTKQRELLERHYPKSVHLDNAYFLTGQLEFQDGRMGEAIRSFGIVRERFPQSGKRAAAMFGTAMAYKRLGLQAQFKRVLQQIVKDHPGSPESQRAWMHLKYEKTGSLKR